MCVSQAEVMYKKSGTSLLSTGIPLTNGDVLIRVRYVQERQKPTYNHTSKTNLKKKNKLKTQNLSGSISVITFVIYTLQVY